MINIDDNQDQSLNKEIETENNQDTTTVSEETAGEATEAQEEVESTEETESQAFVEETEGSLSESSKGANARIRELNAKRKEAEQKAQSLEKKLAQLTRQDSPTDFNQYQQVQDEPLIKPGEEIDAIELDKRLREREQRILQQADARAELRSKQSEAITRINNEAQETLHKYPELDPESDTFNEELSDTITEATEAYVKANPYSASVKGFVDRLMKPYKGAVSKEVGEATKAIAKQASQAAQRPTSIHKTEKTAQEKSIAELEQELGIVQS